MNDTIVAISTSLGVGAISIIKMSGTEAINIVNKVFTKDLTKVPSHTIHYGHIKNKDTIIDEVLVNIMKSPKTFTREDIVEINCHGGIATTNKVLELLLNNGARLSEKGEFTKRAFLNGRIDLIEATSTIDLINSKTDKQRSLAVSGLSGRVSNEIKTLRQNILTIIANIEVNIDYPEYEDVVVVTHELIDKHIYNIQERLEYIIKQSKLGNIIKEGINIVLCGKPNVGKSSLLNKILEMDKAIVTDIEGTTRDIVEGKYKYGRYYFKLL